jgi:hypothetical protein
MDLFCSFVRGAARRAKLPQITVFKHTPIGLQVPESFVNFRIHLDTKVTIFATFWNRCRTEKAPEQTAPARR